MKCATGIQPSPHNSPIYDWAKLLSMRRIKSRARVREKSAGRRGRPVAMRRPAFPERRIAFLSRMDRDPGKRDSSLPRSCTMILLSYTHGVDAPFSVQFFTRSRATEIREKLNIVYRARAPRRHCDRPPTRPIAARPVYVVLKNPVLNDSAMQHQYIVENMVNNIHIIPKLWLIYFLIYCAFLSVFSEFSRV